MVDQTRAGDGTVNPPPLRKGDLVWLTADGRTVGGVVELASANSCSVVLRFKGIIRGYAELLPIRWDAARGTYVDLLTDADLAVHLFDE